MKHLVIGTAGHVDHGKTTLIRALTGTECDTHKEEKSRGITINLGFAHLELTPDLTLGIVDVPGHKDFVHTMVAGASGIDMALLVVAADSGVMPQTREHLDILNALGVRAGLIALTKIDLADEDMGDLAEEEVRRCIEGTFMKSASLIKVSALTGQGIGEVKARLQEVAPRVRERPQGEVFRMFVDNIFSVSGFGTVTAGSVISGTLGRGESAYMLPGDPTPLRVRRIERYGAEVSRVVAGDRAALNVVGFERKDFKRGMALCDRPLRATRMVDVKLRMFGGAGRLKRWSQVMFHLGTCETQAKIHLLDKEAVGPDQTALAQVHLAQACVIQHGDRFVIRNSSGDLTLGGGTVIDAFPLKHRRRRRALLDRLEAVARGDLPDLVAWEVRKRFDVVALSEVADGLNLSIEKTAQALRQGLPEEVEVFERGGQTLLLLARVCKDIKARLLAELTSYHSTHPLEQGGRTTEELVGIVCSQPTPHREAMVEYVLEQLESADKVARHGRTWILAGHGVHLDAAMQKAVATVKELLAGWGTRVTVMADLEADAAAAGVPQRKLEQVLRYLVSQDQAYFTEGVYLDAGVVDQARQQLVQALTGRNEGITVAGFRDLIHANRRFCLRLLAIFDSEGLTRRKGDLRVLNS